MEGPVRYELSDVDRQAPDAIVKYFTFCKLQENINMDKLIEALQQGLDNAIEQLPIMSGNIFVDQSCKTYIGVVPGTRVNLLLSTIQAMSTSLSQILLKIPFTQRIWI